MDTDRELQGTLRQNGHNAKLKQNVFDIEEGIARLHSEEVTNGVQYQMTTAFKKSEEVLMGLGVGLKLNLTTLYDLPALMRECGLELTHQSLYRPDKEPEYFDLIPVGRELTNLHQLALRSAEERPVLEESGLVGVVGSARERFEDLQGRVKKSQLDGRPMATLVDATLPKVKGAILFVAEEDRAISMDLKQEVRGYEEMLSASKASYTKAMSDGDAQVAEESAFLVISALENIIDNLHKRMQYFGEREERQLPFRNTADTLRRGCLADTARAKSEFRTIRTRCEADLSSIHTKIKNADEEDVKALRAWDAYLEEDDAARRRNVEEHEQLFKDRVANRYTMKLDDILARLKDAGRERFQMVTARVDAVEAEETRRVTYSQFLEVVREHKKMLEVTIDNCVLGTSLMGVVEQICLGLSMGVRNWYDHNRMDIHEAVMVTHREHYAAFRELFLAVGTLVYQKHKKIQEIDDQLRKEHIQLEFCAETFDVHAKGHSDAKKKLIALRGETVLEFQMLQEKARACHAAFGESAKELESEGYSFVDPAEELDMGVLKHRVQLVAYKAQFYKEEEVKIAAEEEEIRRLKVLSHRHKLPDIDDPPALM